MDIIDCIWVGDLVAEEIAPSVSVFNGCSARWRMEGSWATSRLDRMEARPPRMSSVEGTQLRMYLATSSMTPASFMPRMCRMKRVTWDCAYHPHFTLCAQAEILEING